jgi:hypothetical protein
MKTVLLVLLILVIALWLVDRIRLVGRIREGKLSREAITEMESDLRKERRDAVVELNAIQSRLILFMKLENEVIEKERYVSVEASSKSQELKSHLKKMEKEKRYWDDNIRSQISQIQEIAAEKTIGFPWLARAYADFFHLQDLKVAEVLREKGPEWSETADKLTELSRQKKASEEKSRMFQYLLEYYEALFPWLPEFRSQGFEEVLEQNEEYYLEEFLKDPVNYYVRPEEMEQRSRSDIFQLALDRYSTTPLSRLQAERNFEQSVIQPFEADSHQVFAIPLLSELPRLGRFFLLKKDNACRFIQCFSGPSDLVIPHPRLLFFIGLVLQKLLEFKMISPKSGGEPVHLREVIDRQNRGELSLSVYTSGRFSDHAVNLGSLFGIDLNPGVLPRKFPRVKCVVHEASGNRTFALPFDQDYYFSWPHRIKTVGFADTIGEAEAKGFRRLAAEEAVSRKPGEDQPGS